MIDMIRLAILGAMAAGLILAAQESRGGEIGAGGYVGTGNAGSWRLPQYTQPYESLFYNNRYHEPGWHGRDWMDDYLRYTYGNSYPYWLRPQRYRAPVTLQFRPPAIRGATP